VILAAIVLILGGILFIIKPNIFRRWFWKRTDVAQRLLKPEHYTIFMRACGALYIVLGILAIIFSGSVHKWLQNR